MRKLIQKSKHTRYVISLACVLGLTLTPGCMTRMADCTVASTKNVKLTKLDLDSLPRKKGIEGKSVQPMFLGIIPLSGRPDIKDALDDALAKGDGDLMVDAVFYMGGWSCILYSENIISVKGEVVKTRTAN